MRKKVDNILGKILVLIMAAMVLNVVWQVFSRYILSTPSFFTDELARYLMIWVGVLGAAFVSGKGMHVAITILPTRLGEQTQKRLASLVALIILLFALFVMVIGGGRLVYISYLLGQKSPALQIPLSAVYLAIPLSGLLIIYYKINDLIKK